MSVPAQWTVPSRRSLRASPRRHRRRRDRRRPRGPSAAEARPRRSGRSAAERRRASSTSRPGRPSTRRRGRSRGPPRGMRWLRRTDRDRWRGCRGSSALSRSRSGLPRRRRRIRLSVNSGSAASNSPMLRWTTPRLLSSRAIAGSSPSSRSISSASANRAIAQPRRAARRARRRGSGAPWREGGRRVGVGLQRGVQPDRRLAHIRAHVPRSTEGRRQFEAQPRIAVRGDRPFEGSPGFVADRIDGRQGGHLTRAVEGRRGRPDDLENVRSMASTHGRLIARRPRARSTRTRGRRSAIGSDRRQPGRSAGRGCGRSARRGS